MGGASVKCACHPHLAYRIPAATLARVCFSAMHVPSIFAPLPATWSLAFSCSAPRLLLYTRTLPVRAEPNAARSAAREFRICDRGVARGFVESRALGQQSE